MTKTLMLAWRLDRIELSIFAACVVALLAGSIYVLVTVAGLPPLTDCAGPSCPSYARMNDQIAIGHLLMLGQLVVAILSGALLGSQLVAREIERGTAPIVWSLSRSRLWWLAPRALIAFGLLLILVTPLAISGHFLEGAIEPGVAPSASLTDITMRGLGLLSIATATFTAGVFLGALFGRMLPALLLTVLVGAGVTAAVFVLPAVVGQPKIIGSVPSDAIAHSIVFEQRFMNSAGESLTLEQAMAAAPVGADPEPWAWEHFDRVAYGISGDDYPMISAVTAGIMMVVSLGLIAAAALVVRRRRPE